MKRLLWLSPVALVLALIFAITTPISAQDDFEVSDLTISPKSTKEGETVTITATVTNIGDTKGTYTLELKINDAASGTKTIEELEPEASQTVTFQVTAGTTGDYIVELDGSSDYFTVKTSFWAMFDPWLWAVVGAIIGVLILFIIVLVVMPSGKKQAAGSPRTKGGGKQAPPVAGPAPMPTPMQPQAQMQPPISGPTSGPAPMPMPTATPTWPQSATPAPIPTPGPMAAPHTPPTGRAMFFMSNLTISPTQAKEGDTITISAVVSNNGTESGNYSVVLRINGVVEGIQELTLAPGISQPATFTLVKDTAGTYYVEVDGLAGTFTVIALIPAHFSVSNLVITPDRVKQGESVIISAVVANTGEVAGNYSVVLKIKGVAENIEEISFGPGISQRISFSVTKDAPGFYQVDLESLTGRFVVEMEWNG